MSSFKEHRARAAKGIRTHLLIGLTAALAISLISFEWKTYDYEVYKPDMGDDISIKVTMLDAIAPSKRKPKTIKNNVIIDRFEVLKDLDSNPDQSEPIEKKEFRPDINYANVGLGDSDILDGPDEDPIDMGSGIIDFSLLQNRPHFADCKNLANKVEQDQCTFLRVRQLVANEANYPTRAAQVGVEGIVKVSFVIGEDGQVRDAEVVRGVHPDLDKEAVRAIMALPKFVPGKVLDKPVKVRFEMPVSFKLR